MKIVMRLVRSVLGRFDYVLWKRAVLRYGVEPYLDIARLSAGWRHPIKVFFDVGANIGQTALPALGVFPDADIFAFEPNRSVFDKLCAASQSPRLHPQQMALSDKTGEATFYEFGDRDNANVMGGLTANAPFSVRHNIPSTSHTIVSCSTIDAFCTLHGIKQIDVLKVDVEGFELSVLKGGERMFSERRIRFVYLEFNDLLQRPGVAGGALMPIAEFLQRNGLCFIGTYTDFINDSNELFVCANALFALPQSRCRNQFD